jgi:hypothetical protein
MVRKGSSVRVRRRAFGVCPAQARVLGVSAPGDPFSRVHLASTAWTPGVSVSVSRRAIACAGGPSLLHCSDLQLDSWEPVGYHRWKWAVVDGLAEVADSRSVLRASEPIAALAYHREDNAPLLVTAIAVLIPDRTDPATAALSRAMAGVLLCYLASPAQAGGLPPRLGFAPTDRALATELGFQATNPPSARLFVSHRTVGSHLYRIFPKLSITSRSELPGAMSRFAPPPGGQNPETGRRT